MAEQRPPLRRPTAPPVPPPLGSAPPEPEALAALQDDDTPVVMKLYVREIRGNQKVLTVALEGLKLGNKTILGLLLDRDKWPWRLITAALLLVIVNLCIALGRQVWALVH